MLYLLFVIILFYSVCTAQVLPGSRQTAICNSDVALSDDVFAVFNNPAGLSQIPWTETGAYYSPSPFGLKELANGFAAFNIPFSEGSLSAGVMTYGYNLYRENKFLISYSRQVTKNLFAGAAINYHHVSIHNYGNDGSIYFNFGIKGFLTNDIHFGFDILNVNHATFGDEQEQIPMVFNSGFSFNFSDIFLLHISVNKDIIYDYSVSGGVEYFLLNILTIRSGVSTKPVKYSAGTGIHIKYFSFDYSLSLHQDLGLTHQISLIYSFNEYENRQKEIKSYLGMNED